MKVNITKPVEVDAKTISVHVKVCDNGNYKIKSSDGVLLRGFDDYVPSIFPEEHFGDYLILDIEIDTGKILNWVVPSREQIERLIDGGER